MPWGKVDDNHYDHPKVLSIPRAIRNAADGLYWRAISRCNRTLSDGWMTTGDLDVIDSDPELVEALVTAGLWERKSDGRLRVHDYLAHNKSKAEVLRERRAKEEAGRAGGLASGRVRAKQTGKQKRSNNEAGASRVLQANANGIEAPGVELPSSPVPTRPLPSGSIEPDALTARTDETNRHGLPHIDPETQAVAERVSGRLLSTLHGHWATELDRLTEDRGAHRVQQSLRRVAATFPEKPSWPQLIAGVRNDLEPLPSSGKAMTESERKDAEIAAAIAQVKAEAAGARA